MGTDTPAPLDVIVRRLLEYTQRYERQRDGRCVFTFVYALMTSRISAELDTSGFGDPTWITELSQAFSQRYFDALDEADHSGPIAPPWDAVFALTRDHRTSVAEDVAFGMMAHIVHDLPQGLVQVGLLDATGESRIADFHAMNAILGRSVDPILVQVSRRYSPILRWLDRLGTGYNEILTKYGITMSRGLAWYNAERLLDPRSSAAAAIAIAQNPLTFIHTVLRPRVWSIALVLRGVRVILSLGRRWPRSVPALPTGWQ
jgi:hypothetical protein